MLKVIKMTINLDLLKLTKMRSLKVNLQSQTSKKQPSKKQEQCSTKSKQIYEKNLFVQDIKMLKISLKELKIIEKIRHIKG